ncbi:MAG: KUP/HAK/KT family potassium transporter [Duncaniella sp.]|nr:KUP/HAK/KT family potassium transporter [Duncaniella sp.]
MEKSKSSPHSSLKHVSAMGLLVTMGIVFGDIGTSPLYVMKAIIGVNPHFDADYVIGAVSCVIWTLTLQTTVKYVLIALHADNKGEGGILALYSLLRRLPRRWLYVVAAVGASTLIADGVITPAITVTSAIEGLRIVEPAVPVVPIVVIIIIAIFLMQQAGTGKIGRYFGPFMLVWFTMLGVLGALHLGDHIAILKAFNPWYAVRLLVDYPGWFLILGAVFLCTTGAEALYSDLGHCGRMNISVSWIFVKLMLILNYLGQGAWIINGYAEAPAGVNPFYGIMPHWFTVAGVVMSTGAAIIASQALLSGSFTIFSEAINLGFWPRLKIKYPSTEKGQLYIPAVNWTLLIGCLLTVAMFRTSSHMEAAYGLAITITMLMTTILLTFYLRHHGVSRWLCGVFLVVFASLETVFFAANMVKFAHGGWFTIMIAGLVAVVMIGWRNSTRMRNTFIEYRDLADYLGIIKDIKADADIPKYASNVIYFSRSGNDALIESKLIYSIINKQPKRADHYWIIHIENVDAPETLEYSVKVIVPQTVYFVTLRLGFRVDPKVSVYLRQIVEDLVDEGSLDLVSGYPSLRRRAIAGNFRFIIIHRIFSPSSSCRKGAAFLMRLHEWLRRLGISDQTAMGLDTSVVTLETVPLIINNTPLRRIARVECV